MWSEMKRKETKHEGEISSQSIETLHLTTETTADEWWPFPFLSFRVTDSAFRAVALSKRTLSIFHRVLWTNVTLSPRDLLSFHHSLEHNQELGRLVRLFRFLGIEYMQDCSDEEEKALYDGLQSFSTLPLSAPADEKLLDGYNKVTQSIYIKLVSVETLLIHYSDAIPPFRQRIDGKLSTAPLFTNSLRRLFIPRWRDSDDSREKRLSANNVAWILTFSPSLVEACLSFSVSISDFNHLREHETALYGLSNVRRLALEFYFTFNEAEKSSWWGSPSENRESWKGGNKKMHAIWVLLSLTKNLTSLELYQS